MNRRGLIMVTVGLLAVALLAVIGVFTGGLDLMARSQEISAATDVARELLERVKSQGVSFIPGPPAVFDGRAPDPRVGVSHRTPTLAPWSRDVPINSWSG